MSGIYVCTYLIGTFALKIISKIAVLTRENRLLPSENAGRYRRKELKKVSTFSTTEDVSLIPE